MIGHLTHITFHRPVLLAKEFHYRWEWDLESSPRALWPLVADTNRFNRDAGVPPVEHVAKEALHNVRRQLRLFKLGVAVEWEEDDEGQVFDRH